MKKLVSLLLALSLVFCLTACGEDTAPETKQKAKGGKTEPEKVTGEIYDAGTLSVFVPEGWMASPVMDMWSDDPEATSPDKLNLIKGGTSELDLLTKPNLQILCYEPDSLIPPRKDFYENAEDIDPIVAGELTWEGFCTEDLMGAPLIILWTTNADGYQFQINAFYETDTDTFSMTDRDVMAILEGVSIS